MLLLFVHPFFCAAFFLHLVSHCDSKIQNFFRTHKLTTFKPTANVRHFRMNAHDNYREMKRVWIKNKDTFLFLGSFEQRRHAFGCYCTIFFFLSKWKITGWYFFPDKKYMNIAFPNHPIRHMYELNGVNVRWSMRLIFNSINVDNFLLLLTERISNSWSIVWGSRK